MTLNEGYTIKRTEGQRGKKRSVLEEEKKRPPQLGDTVKHYFGPEKEKHIPGS